MNIRSVKLDDAARILEIYSPHITNSSTSFETDVPSIDEFKKRISEYTSKFPWIVYELDGKVVGYAYASAHRSRCAYEWSVESSVYVDPDFQGKGVGSKLYQELFKLLKTQGVVNIFAGITLPNEGSIKLHESLGFTYIGKFMDVGFKQGQWWDVGWWQLQLQRPVEPKSLCSPKTI